MQSSNQLNFFNSREATTWQKPPSLIKWSGSKRSLAQLILPHFPNFERYFEPFLGSGAMLYNIAKPDVQCFGGDIYRPLIELWKLVKEKPEKLVEIYTHDWELLQQSFPEHYYKVRERFNQRPNGQDLMFLSRTCVNGIIRFNSKGEFNNSLHVSRRGMTPSNFKKIVEQWHPKLKSVELFCSDFQDLIETVQPNDFVYMDPPYLGSKNRYLNNLNAAALLEVLEKLNLVGAKWALSFDGSRGEYSYDELLPKELYKDKLPIQAGWSAVNKVLNQSNQEVTESLYINY